MNRKPTRILPGSPAWFLYVTPTKISVLEFVVKTWYPEYINVKPGSWHCIHGPNPYGLIPDDFPATAPSHLCFGTRSEAVVHAVFLLLETVESLKAKEANALESVRSLLEFASQ